MIAPRESALLQKILRRETRSLLQYVGDTFPWPTLDAGAALTVLENLVASERDAAAELARFLARQRQSLPWLGPYPQDFTTLNYVSLDNLLPRIIQSEQDDIAQLESDLAALTSEDARAEVEKILAIKRRNLETLRQLRAKSEESRAPRAI